MKTFAIMFMFLLCNCGESAFDKSIREQNLIIDEINKTIKDNDQTMKEISCITCLNHYTLCQIDVTLGKTNGMSERAAEKLCLDGYNSCMEFHNCEKKNK